MNQTNNSFSFDEFLNMSEEEFLGKLMLRHSFNHISEASMQTVAWRKEFHDMQYTLRGRKGRIIFEYSIPELSKTIDIVLLMNGKIFVIEYKVNAVNFSKDNIQQVLGYALRLKYFHSTSNDYWIIPILVATNAPSTNPTYDKSNDDMVYHTIMCNSADLGKVISTVDQQIPYHGDSMWMDTWEHGIFKASPTIIAAARNVWEANNVRGFSLGESDSNTRLAAEDYIVNVVVPQTKDRHGKSIVFVTGVPGAGKTLVGLNCSVRLQDYGASMLSGNGPLVKVLTASLKKDLNKNKKNLNKPINLVSVDTIIRDAYGYKKEIFEKRMDYQLGGHVSLRKDAEMGSQHVIIFDEAQRAWNKQKMIMPGMAGRQVWQEEAFPFSEPGLLLWDMNQMDWGVFICLVGGGQEINTGEAGISEWLKTVEEDPEFKDWHVYMADEFQGAEYNSSDGTSVEEYRQRFESEGRITFSPSLHLTASQRSIRTEKVSLLIQELLNCNQSKARELYKSIKNKYRIYLTRNVDEAKSKLIQRKKDLEAMFSMSPNVDINDFRIGMLMSSKAARLRPLGFEIKKVSEYLSKVSNWFLDPQENVNSSDYLEVALNEFFVQGLELDFDAVIWDADFRYDPGKNTWRYYEFNGYEWKPRENDSDSQIIKRFYMKNAYRVLLTRARAGMVIVVPEGSTIDHTRNPSIYNDTYDYLKGIGFDII